MTEIVVVEDVVVVVADVGTGGVVRVVVALETAVVDPVTVDWLTSVVVSAVVLAPGYERVRAAPTRTASRIPAAMLAKRALLSLMAYG